MNLTPELPSQHEEGAEPSESTSNPSAKQKWAPTQQAFDKFLGQLCSDREEAGQRYEVVRIRLLRFFEWRGCDSTELRADETLDRVMRRIDEGQVISNLMGYIYSVARLVFMEELKDRERTVVLEDDFPLIGDSPQSDSEADDHQLRCFDRCLEELPQDYRNLILSYYQEEKHAKIELRRKLAEQLSIPLNALRIRAHRIRKTLEECIQTCLARQA